MKRHHATKLPAGDWAAEGQPVGNHVSGYLTRYVVECFDPSSQDPEPSIIARVPDWPSEDGERIARAIAAIPHMLTAIRELVAEADNGHHVETGAVVLARDILDALKVTA